MAGPLPAEPRHRDEMNPVAVVDRAAATVAAGLPVDLDAVRGELRRIARVAGRLAGETDGLARRACQFVAGVAVDCLPAVDRLAAGDLAGCARSLAGAIAPPTVGVPDTAADLTGPPTGGVSHPDRRLRGRRPTDGRLQGPQEGW